MHIVCNCAFTPLQECASFGMIQGTCSVNKDQNNGDTKTVVLDCECRGALHILLSPAGLTAAFKATLEMTGEKVSCQLGAEREREEKVGAAERGREREEQGEKRGYK